jgi:iron uptake system component EfeO
MRQLLVPVLAIAGLSLVAGCADGHAAAVTTPTRVSVSVTACGTGWSAHRAGPQHLVLQNTDSRPGEVRLVAPSTGAVFADIEPLGPGTSRPLDITLAAGSYAFRCVMEDEAAVTGRPVRLVGEATAPAPGVVPADQAELIAPTQRYERYVRARLPSLAAQVRRLRADVAGNDLVAARADWLRAHLAYEHLGAAYDAFGDLDAVVNGLPDGLPRGRHDPGWTGFHRVELGLFHAASARSLLPEVDRLSAGVSRLRTRFDHVQVDPLTLTIRAHEIAENALQTSLTGHDDFGSHTGLATVLANLEGTRRVLAMLRPALTERHLDLAVIEASLDRAERAAAQGRRGGHWLAPSAMPRREREAVDSAVGQLAERLASVASVLEPRRTS